jgi:hypothetical protein
MAVFLGLNTATFFPAQHGIGNLYKTGNIGAFGSGDAAVFYKHFSIIAVYLVPGGPNISRVVFP